MTIQQQYNKIQKKAEAQLMTIGLSLYLDTDIKIGNKYTIHAMSDDQSLKMGLEWIEAQINLPENQEIARQTRYDRLVESLANEMEENLANITESVEVRAGNLLNSIDYLNTLRNYFLELDHASALRSGTEFKESREVIKLKGIAEYLESLVPQEAKTILDNLRESTDKRAEEK